MADQKVNIKVTTQGATKAKQEMGGLSGSISKMGKAVGIATTAYFGARGLISGLSSVITLAGEQEQAEKKLSFALGRTSKALLDQATALQKTTRFGDEATIAQMGFLASIGFTEEKIQQVIPVAMDLAEATGMSLESAVRNTAKTFSGMAGELGELVPQIRELTAEQMKAGEAVKVMGDLFEGQASAQAETLTGKLEQTKNAVGDAGESLGELLAPTVILTANAVAFLSDKLVNGAKFIGDLIIGEEIATEVTNEFAGSQKKLAEETERANVALKDQLTEEQLRNQFSEKTVAGYQSEIAQLQELKMVLQGKSELEIEMRKAGGESGVSDAIKQEIDLVIALRKEVKLLQEAEDERNEQKIESEKEINNLSKQNTEQFKLAKMAEDERFASSISGARGLIKSLLAQSIASIIAQEVGKKSLLGLVTGSLGAIAVTSLFDSVVPKFAEGGIVQGDPNRGDTVPVMATAGELILNQAQQENLVANNGITINISAPLVDETVVDSIIPAIERAKSLGTA